MIPAGICSLNSRMKRTSNSKLLERLEFAQTVNPKWLSDVRGRHPFTVNTVNGWGFRTMLAEDP